jgi:hypothetical protein
MAKRTTALTGTAKKAFFERTLQKEAELDGNLRARLVARLSQDVQQVRVRDEILAGLDQQMEEAPRSRASAPKASVMKKSAKASAAPEPDETAIPVPDEPAAPATFDPYSPNVIVVVRTEGRAAALTALSAIESPRNLRLLAREQQLSVDAALETPADLCEAIVAAAERRIANRRAAAS